MSKLAATLGVLSVIAVTKTPRQTCTTDPKSIISTSCSLYQFRQNSVKQMDVEQDTFYYEWTAIPLIDLISPARTETREKSQYMLTGELSPVQPTAMSFQLNHK